MLQKMQDFFQKALHEEGGWHKETLILIIGVILFNLFAKWILRTLHHRFSGQKKFWQDSFVQALYTPLSCFAWFFAFIYTIEILFPSLISHFIVLRIAAVIAISWFLMRWKNYLIQLWSEAKGEKVHLDRTKLDVIDKAVTILVIFLALLFLLEATGNSVNTLLAFGGIGGLAIAFASQEVISNYFSGLMIYATKPFTIGDWIDIPERNIEGHVEEIGWYLTRVRTFEMRPVYVPNSFFSKMVVVTPSRMSHRHFKEQFRLRYQDANLVEPLSREIKEMLQKHPAIDKREKIIVNLDSLGQYALEIQVRAYTHVLDTAEFASIKQDIFLQILSLVDKHGAEIAIVPSGTNI
jgi:MscS family membrane protein